MVEVPQRARIGDRGGMEDVASHAISQRREVGAQHSGVGEDVVVLRNVEARVANLQQAGGVVALVEDGDFNPVDLALDELHEEIMPDCDPDVNKISESENACSMGGQGVNSRLQEKALGCLTQTVLPE